MPTRNVFVLGLDDINLRTLSELPDAGDLRFHGLLDHDELLDMETLDLPGQLAAAERTLEEFDGSVDAIVGYWDFPVSSMVPILCERFGLPGPRLEGVVRAEHKYWSRQVQAEVIDDHPAFALVPLPEDGDHEPPKPPEGVPFPMWLKPVKGVSSQLAYKVEDEAQFDRAVREIADHIDEFSEPFDEVLDRVDLPPELAEVGGRACVAEEAVTGRQFTVEGYCVDDVPVVYGVVESVLYPGRPNFQRYEYPANLPQQVQDRMVDDSEQVMARMGIGSGTFNIEYFWDPKADRVRLLEVNPRHSQAHAELFELVDGAPHHQVAIQIALGQEPRMPRREGAHAVAGKVFVRVFAEDGEVVEAPSADDVARVEREYGVRLNVEVEPGMRLSDLEHQDPYSFSLADVVVGANDVDQLAERHHAAVDALGFVVQETPRREPGGGEATGA